MDLTVQYNIFARSEVPVVYNSRKDILARVVAVLLAFEVVYVVLVRNPIAKTTEMLFVTVYGSDSLSRDGREGCRRARRASARFIMPNLKVSTTTTTTTPRLLSTLKGAPSSSGLTLPK
jgi:hypothetical protein